MSTAGLTPTAIHCLPDVVPPPNHPHLRKKRMSIIHHGRQAAAVLGVLALTALTAPIAHAAGEQSEPRINPWLDCGIGAMIFGGIEGDIGMIATAVSNITWDLGTTATSSATLSPSTCRGADATAAIYIQQNLKVVQDDVARGSGEHLGAVWSIYGCDPALRPTLTEAARQSAVHVFSDRSYHALPVSGQAESLWLTFSDAVQSAPAGACKA